MKFIKIRLFGLFFALICSSIVGLSVKTGGSLLTNQEYWYGFETFHPGPDEYWNPFYALTDIPESLPLRGFTGNTRSYFFDLGAFEWFSSWLRYVYGYTLDPNEYQFNPQGNYNSILDGIEYYFGSMLNRLTSMGLSLDYATDLTDNFEVWTPMVVINGLDETYDDSGIQDWIVLPDSIISELERSFPLFSWFTDYFYYDYDNATAFSILKDSKTQGSSIIVDEEFINQTGEILYDIIRTDPNFSNYDLIFPNIIFILQDESLYYPGFGGIGGLGQISSNHSEINFWSMNGRDKNSYFYGGDPTKIRDSLTTTVLHELGHCIGLPHPHDEGAWFLDSTTISDMGYYARTTKFDYFEHDLVFHGITLQLIGKYLDEIAFFRSKTLSPTQEASLSDIEDELLTIEDKIITNNYSDIKKVFLDTEIYFIELSNELAISRKDSNWSTTSPSLKLKLDLILGPGVPVRDQLITDLKSSLQTQGIFTIANTTLPNPVYDVNMTFHVTNTTYDVALAQAFSNLAVSSTTSNYDHVSVPPTAWSIFPRNQIFITQNGYEIDGYSAEEWIDFNPATPDVDDEIHYRLYLFDLKGLLEFSDTNETYSTTTTTAISSTSNGKTSDAVDFMLVAIFLTITAKINYRRSKKYFNE